MPSLFRALYIIYILLLQVAALLNGSSRSAVVGATSLLTAAAANAATTADAVAAMTCNGVGVPATLLDDGQYELRPQVRTPYLTPFTPLFPTFSPLHTWLYLSYHARGPTASYGFLFLPNASFCTYHFFLQGFMNP